jgi:hypothetical protein
MHYGHGQENNFTTKAQTALVIDIHFDLLRDIISSCSPTSAKCGMSYEVGGSLLVEEVCQPFWRATPFNGGMV